MTGSPITSPGKRTSPRTASVDRLNQIPARLALLFDYDANAALASPGIREEMTADGARAVAVALAEELASAPRLDRQKFRAVANQVKAKTGQKAKALYYKQPLLGTLAVAPIIFCEAFLPSARSVAHAA